MARSGGRALRDTYAAIGQRGVSRRLLAYDPSPAFAAHRHGDGTPLVICCLNLTQRRCRKLSGPNP